MTVAQPSLFVTELVDAGVVTMDMWDPAPPDDERVTPHAAPPVDWPMAPHPAQERRRAFAERVLRLIDSAGGGTEDVRSSDGGLSDDLPLVNAVRMALADRDHRLHHSSEVWAPTHMSTSAMVTLRSDPEAFVASVRRPMPSPPTVAAARGSVLHEWIERHYGHATLIPEEGEAETPDPVLSSAIATFAASEWAGRKPIAIEVPVDVTIAGVVVRSRIDAVFPAGHGLERVTVVDWKSGSAPRDPEARRAREVQLAVYRLAWAALTDTSVDQIDAAFYYVADDSTVRPKVLLGRQELEELVLSSYAVGADSAIT